MLHEIFELAMTAAAAATLAVLPIIVPALRRWLISTARLEKIVGDGELAKRLDAGVMNLIENAIREIANLPRTEQPGPESVVELAIQKTQRQFPETLQKLGMNGVQTREYVKARVAKATSERDPGHR